MWNSRTLFPHGDAEDSPTSARLSTGVHEVTAISRPRLPAAMATRAPLNVVHGPPGIGKTVLLSQWEEQFREAGHEVIWIDAALIEENANGFWREVLRGVDPAKLSVAVDAPKPQAEFALALAKSTGNVLILVDDVRHADDYIDNVGLREVIASSPRFRIVIAARTTSSDLMGASILGPEELCFSGDEVRRVLELKGVQMSAASREKLASVLRGWPGLIDIAATALGGGGHSNASFDSAIQAAVDYLAVAMRSDVDPAPVTPFMQAAVPATCLNYAVDIQDWALATAVITQSWAHLSGWHKPLLFRALYTIPRAEMDKNADTRMVFRFLTNNHPTDEDEIPLPAEHDQLLGTLYEDNRTKTLVRTYTAVNWYRRGRRFGELSEVCDRALVILDAARRDAHPDGRNELALGYLHVGVAHVLLGEFGKAERELKYATRLAGADAFSPMVAAAAGFLALICAFDGGVDDATHWLKLEAEQSVTGSLDRSSAKTARLLVAMENLDREATMHECEELDDPLAELESWPFIAYALSEWHRIYGDPHSNLETVRMRRSLHGDSEVAGGITPVLLAVIETNALLALGHLEIAKKAIAGVDHVFADHVKSQLLIKDGDPAGALALMDVNRWFERPSGPSIRVERLLVVFMAHDALRNRRAAAEALRQAIAVSDVAGNFRAYVHVARQLLASYTDEVPRVKAVLDIVDRSGARVEAKLESPKTLLSSREVEVIRSLSLNPTYARVAEDLFVSTSTVKTHVATIHKKFGTRERAELLRMAANLGILE